MQLLLFIYLIYILYQTPNPLLSLIFLTFGRTYNLGLSLPTHTHYFSPGKYIHTVQETHTHITTQLFLLTIICQDLCLFHLT